jgi:pimeloyl-ACP methyl ester carboxylesterase
MSEQVVPTRVGPLRVGVVGDPDRPVALLWHSLFVDERTWQRVLPDLAQDRQLVVVTGPGHGRSGDSGHRYSIQDCAEAAVEVLDNLRVEGPVDWVGNAWGGHVGVVVSARHPQRVHTLVTCGTPLHPYPLGSRISTNLLLFVYRLVGPVRFVSDAVVDALLSEQTRTSDAQAVDLVRDCFTRADRAGMANAVVSVSLKRRDLTLVTSIQAPTLFITGSEHPDWSPEQMTAAAALLPHGSTHVVQGAAYLAPLEDPADFGRCVRQFWAEHPAVADPAGREAGSLLPDDDA